MYIQLLIATQIFFLVVQQQDQEKKDGGEVKEREMMFII